MIKAITFDLWDTVFIDDSDEPKRSQLGLNSKSITRRKLVYSALEKTAPMSMDLIEVGYRTVDAAFKHAWYYQNTTWTVPERLSLLMEGLNVKLPQKEFSELVRLHEEMELEVMPDLAEGIKPTLEALSSRYKLGIISDTVFSPGRVLRLILERYDLLQYFTGFVFSDEVGCAKPDSHVFTKVAEELGVDLAEIAHVGDREEKDVAGPHAVGSKAVLTTVVLDRGSQNSKADIICQDYSQLPDQLEQL